MSVSGAKQSKQRNVLIAGGAGFLGSHLCKAFLDKGDRVTCVDNLVTGRKTNVTGLLEHPDFTLVTADISRPLPRSITSIAYDVIANLASPASPPKYFAVPLETLLVGSVGTNNLLALAKRCGARYMHASTSEVYGEPSVHPQPESYWGNVNSYGPRSMYDEAKRFGEAMVYTYRNTYHVDTCISRTFNTYGPNMDPEDGRVVSNFIVQALKNEPITIFGDGKQTRSFCYVSDQIEGMVKLIDSGEEGPVNLGNPDEFTLLELAEKVIALTKSKSKVVHRKARIDDPTHRKPDGTKARQLLGWEPTVSLDKGLLPTIAYFKGILESSIR